jgi:hypothetical protein
LSPPAPPPLFPARPAESYPVLFDVAYPERLSRWKTLLRVVLVIPAWLFAWLLTYFVGTAFAAGWTTVFWRRKYPAWLFAGLAGALGFTARLGAYASLLTDRYPSFDPEQSPVTLEFDPPPSGQLSRWRVCFWKFFLLIPHFFVLFFLQIAVGVVTFLAWFAILFTGRYPRGLFGFVTGVMRWQFRVAAYFASFNDRFPPFALSAEAGPGAPASAVICGVLGLVLGGGFTGLVVTAAILADEGNMADVDYQALTRGRANVPAFYTGFRNDPTFIVSLESAVDPATDLAKALETPASDRVVVFEWLMANFTSGDREMSPTAAKLDYRGGDGDDTATGLITVDGRLAPTDLVVEVPIRVRAAFTIPKDATPTELRMSPPWPTGGGTVTYRFR